MATRTPTLASVHGVVREGIMRDLHVAFPAEVRAYDASKQVVDVQPLLAEYFVEDDDTITQVRPSVIPHVPVVFPGAGGFRVTFPIQVGDTVLCVVADRSIDVWSAQGGFQQPNDLRRHNRSDAIAIPGLHPDNKAWAGASTSAITIGRDGGADDAVALASKVHDALESLKTAFNAHKHTSNALGLLTSPTDTPASPDTAVASASVKIKE